VQNAIDWLEKNQDKSLDDIKAEDAEASSAPQTTTAALEGDLQAHSLVCNECGKKFRTHAQAEFHATKTCAYSPLRLLVP
jgi:UBX domain-containing protein 1/4